MGDNMQSDLGAPENGVIRCEIQWDALKAAFENHSGGAKSVLDKATGEVLDVKEGLYASHNNAHFLTIVPVPSRVQYQMMEIFIGTVTSPNIHSMLQDTIVGKGAFRRFKDALAKFPLERKRWFTFRDALLHQHIFDWLDENHVAYDNPPDWNLNLPAAAPHQEDEVFVTDGEQEPTHLSENPQSTEELQEFLMAWARSHGGEYGYVFGPAAFHALGNDLNKAFSFSKRL